MALKLTKKQADHITLGDIFSLTADGSMQWSKVEPSSFYPWETLRCLFKGRLYILRRARMEVFNAKDDALIWFAKDASNLRAMIETPKF